MKFINGSSGHNAATIDGRVPDGLDNPKNAISCLSSLPARGSLSARPSPKLPAALAFWVGLRQGKSVLGLAPAILSLMLFASLLTLVPGDSAGRA